MSKIITIFKGLIRYTPLLMELVKRDIKVRYRHSVLGMLWTVLNPLLNMIVMTIVFSNIFRADIRNFPLYVMIGNVIYNFNSEATNQGMNSIVWNSTLIKKVYIPKYLFPLSNVLSSLVNFVFSFIAMLLVMVFTSAEFHLTMIGIVVPLAMLMVFSFGFSLILCSVNVFFRDMQHLYAVFLTAWMYLSGVFYSVDIVMPELQPLILFNPLYQYISYFRILILDGFIPSIGHTLVCLAWAVAVLIIGLVVFYKTQDKFILHI